MKHEIKQDYLGLIKRANALFQGAYPGSILFSAVGSPVSGVAKTADELANWVFRAQTTKNGTALMAYSGGTFGSPTIIGEWLGLRFEALPQGTIRLPQAIEILNANGYTQGFSNVGLGTPAQLKAQPMFWFCVGKQTQGVSASTGQFFPDLFPCQPEGIAGSLRR